MNCNEKNKTVKYIDLFAGAGGLSLGLHNAGLQGLFAIEKNADAFRTLQYNLIERRNHFDWPDWLPQTPHDICELVADYKEQLISLRGQVDLVAGGPPCQGFSMAGLRDHNDIRNTMINYYLKVIEYVKPTMVLFENVHGFTLEFKEESEGKPYSEIVLEKLKVLGYNVQTKEVLLSDYSIPQKRVRFFLVASLTKKVDNFFKQLEDNREHFCESRKIEARTTVKQAIGDLLKEFGTYKCPDCKQIFLSGIYGKACSKYQVLMRKHYKYKNPDSHRFANHKKTTIELHQKIIDNVAPNKRITPKDNLVEGLKKRGVTLLDEKGQSPTVTSHPDDMIHYSEPRILTVREMARLQSFPDDYEFKGKYTTGGVLRKTDVPRYTQVGNAVPPLFSEQIGIILRRILSEI